MINLSTLHASLRFEIQYIQNHLLKPWVHWWNRPALRKIPHISSLKASRSSPSCPMKPSIKILFYQQTELILYPRVRSREPSCSFSLENTSSAVWHSTNNPWGLASSPQAYDWRATYSYPVSKLWFHDLDERYISCHHKPEYTWQLHRHGQTCNTHWAQDFSILECHCRRTRCTGNCPQLLEKIRT